MDETDKPRDEHPFFALKEDRQAQVRASFSNPTIGEIPPGTYIRLEPGPKPGETPSTEPNGGYWIRIDESHNFIDREGRIDEHRFRAGAAALPHFNDRYDRVWVMHVEPGARGVHGKCAPMSLEFNDYSRHAHVSIHRNGGFEQIWVPRGAPGGRHERMSAAYTVELGEPLVQFVHKETGRYPDAKPTFEIVTREKEAAPQRREPTPGEKKMAVSLNHFSYNDLPSERYKNGGRRELPQGDVHQKIRGRSGWRTKDDVSRPRVSESSKPDHAPVAEPKLASDHKPRPPRA